MLESLLVTNLGFGKGKLLVIVEVVGLLIMPLISVPQIISSISLLGILSLLTGFYNIAKF
jgi:hypothetical protein